MFLKIFIAVCLLFVANVGYSQDQLSYPEQPRAWMVNEDGSCVQCSIAMCGVWQNCPQASTLLFNSPFGPAVRGGSYPSRVEAYSDRRGIPCYNVTGSNTWEWMKWGAKTGRLCAIGCFSSHFQTLLWYNPDPRDSKPWKVSNNWQGICGKNFEYTEAEFKQYHLASGQWVVILKTPPPPPCGAEYVKWW